MRKKTERCNGDAVAFETALNLTGFGRFHYELIAACALSVITIGFQNGVTSYVFPSAQCELGLTSFELGLLNVAFLLGGAVSCFLWGTLSDAVGRKRILALCHLLNVAVTVVCASSAHGSSLLACRFVNGFAAGGPGSIIFSHLAEFQPVRYRSPVVCCCGLFFTFSWLLLPLIAYAVLQIEVYAVVWGLVVISPWRIFMVLLTVPELVVAAWFLRLPDSPKFLVAQGDVTKALAILRIMYSANTGRSPDEYPVSNLTEANKTEPGKSEGKMWKKTVREMGLLFRGTHLKTTLLTSTIMFCNMFGTFGLGLWLPELFIRFEQFHKQFPNSTATVKELSRLEQTTSTSCVPSFDKTVLLSTVAMAVSSMVYNVTCSMLSSRVKINTILMASMILGGLSSASIYFLRSSVQNLIVACVFQATMITGNIAIGNVGVNLFPTTAAGVALCLVMCFGRIGAICSNVIFGYYMDTNCEVPIFAVAITVLSGAFLCIFIPKEDQRPTKKVRSTTTDVFIVETKFSS